MSVQMRRSQVILRMPVDHVLAAMIMHDGARSDVVLFVPPTEDIGRVLSSGATFLPMINGGKVCVVARAAIACLGVPAIPKIPREDDLPVIEQKVVVILRSGQKIEGALHITAPAGQQRTADALNEDIAFVEVFAGATTYYVVKAHIAQVEEA